MQRYRISLPLPKLLEDTSRGELRGSATQEGRNRRAMTIYVVSCALALLVQTVLVCLPAHCASDLRLAPNLSFDDDSSPNFPIQGRDLTEASTPSGTPTLIFFGTSNCWNTAREAERLVRLYPRFRGRIHFVIIDLNNVTPAQEALVSRYYHGYIPTITAIDSKGNVIYNRAGETASTRGDTTYLQHLFDSLY